MTDISKRKEEIQLLVAANNLDKASKRTMDFVRDFATDRSKMRQVIDISTALSEDGPTNNNNLIFRLLELVDEVCNSNKQ